MDVDTTNRSLDCALQGTISSVSAMVFMEDSERAALLAQQHKVEAGIHLNFTKTFSTGQCPPKLIEHQRKLSHFLRSNRYAPIIYHSGLAVSFEYAVKAQLEEFERLYGVPPIRVDGHHHMHLCANVLLAELIPAGTLARRSFSFASGEKSWMNRIYRRWVDKRLQRHHRLVDYLFSLAPIEPRDRLQRIVSLACHSMVELETHPINPPEYRFLVTGEIFKQLDGLQVAHGFATYVSRGAIPGRSTL
jgi:hypothetical protein